jgi:radical SAM protein with 4Fe4S-binding SPASM domain
MKTDIGHVVFEVTRQCNYGCRFCYNHWKKEGFEYNETPSYRQIQKTLNKLFSQANIRHIAFTGGEPMLQERLPELILNIKMRQCKATLLTNGSLLSDESIECLKLVRVDGVQIPVLSHRKEVHDYLTQSPGSWQISVDAIQRLNVKGIHVIAIMVVTALNLEDIEPAFALIKSLNCGRVLLNRFNLGGSGLINQKELWLTPENVKRLYHIADQAALKHGLQVSCGVCTPVCIADPADYKHLRFSFCNSQLLHRPVTVDYLGNVRFCNHSPVELGNIFNETIDQIVQNKNLNAIFAEVPEMCGKCKKLTLCYGGCRAAAQQAGKGFNSPDPVLGKF